MVRKKSLNTFSLAANILKLQMYVKLSVITEDGILNSLGPISSVPVDFLMSIF